MIAILDYGAGNLRSVQLAFARMGLSAQPTRDPAVVERASGVILPGVGAFADAMQALNASRSGSGDPPNGGSGPSRFWEFVWECRLCLNKARRVPVCRGWDCCPERWRCCRIGG